MASECVTTGSAERRNSISKVVLAAMVVMASFTACGSDSKYEVIERTQKEVPNFQNTGTHTAVDYVLLHEGHKFYTSCDVTTLNSLDPSATCGFLPLRKYECTIQTASLEKATWPLSDLKCKDGDGHNVYLYVTKKE